MAKRSDEKLMALPEVGDLLKTAKQKKDRMELEALIKEAHSLSEAVECLANIKKRIIELAQGYEGVRVGKYCAMVSWVKGRRSLSREKLVEVGVTPEQLEAGTTEGEGYWKCELPAIED